LGTRLKLLANAERKMAFTINVNGAKHGIDADGEVECRRDGEVRVRRVVCAIDWGSVVNPDTVWAQVQGAAIFGISAALYGDITLRAGRVQQTNLDSY
jgi:CO/xanthine dehydrogenase Mo-binding subunit